MSNQENAIEVKNLTKEFVLPHKRHNSLKQAFVNLGRRGGVDRRKILNDISFDIKKGDFFGIVGRNGSGKSTLLKILAGVYTPTGGHAWVNGTLTPFIELGVGFNMELSGRDNVYLNGALLGFTHKQMGLMYEDIVNFAELQDFMDQKLKNYSSGMLVRLAFSIAIRAQSDILLIDEVLAVGDAAFQQKCFDYFEGLKTQKKTVVFVTHDMSAVRRFCNRAIYLQDGSLGVEGSSYDVSERYVQDNIDIEEEHLTEKIPGEKPSNKISGKIETVADGEQILKVNYSSAHKDDLFIGISILKDGMTIAELTTEKELKLNGSGRVTYSVDTKNLNGGAYGLTVALFRTQNRELIAVGKKQIMFTVKGSGDSSRGGSLKLAGGWNYDPSK